MRRAAAERLAQADIWAAQRGGAEARAADACCGEWKSYSGHIDHDIAYRRQLIIDYQREWQSYRETMADTALRRSVLGQVMLTPVSQLVLSQVAQDERTYAALARSAEAPATDSGFAVQPVDMEQVNWRNRTPGDQPGRSARTSPTSVVSFSGAIWTSRCG